MKKLLVLICCLISISFTSNAQSCYETLNIEIIPENPCQGEDVVMVVENSFCAICDCEADNLSLNPYTFPTTFDHLFLGSECDFPCTSIDTIALGTMPYGNMLFNYSLIVDTASYFSTTQQIEVINCTQINYPTTFIDTSYFSNETLCYGDSLELTIELFTSAACDCNSNSYALNLNGIMPQLNTYYAFGFCLATCNSVETFNIGLWEIGNHSLQINSISNEIMPYQFLNSATITFEVEDCTNAIDVFVDEAILLYPNPVENQFTIEGLMGNYSIKILDVSGNVYQTISTNLGTYTIDINQLPSGLFFIAIEKNSNGNVRLEKILKF